MEKKIILFDTDILIKIYRGNKELRKELVANADNVGISVITMYELLEGCNSKLKLEELQSQVTSYQIIKVDTKICDEALLLFKKYKPNHPLRVADTLIAATALVHGIELFTDNKKDYQFIKEIKFYNPK